MAPKDQISHYELLDLLGEGGMGKVYRAIDINLDRPVAIKVLTDRMIGDPEFLERFKREARLAAQLNHPNIATIYEFGEEDGTAYLAMEFVEGKTLQQLMQGRGLAFDDIYFLGGQAARALALAHSRGIVHRDIKAPNLMLTADGNLKVMDFGVARRTGDTQLTMEGALVGTAHIMAPEIIEGKVPGPAADLFSLGCVLYEMATGSPAFSGETASTILYQVAHKDPVPPRELRPDIPEDLEELIASLLVKDPAERFGPTEAVAHALEFPGVPWEPPPEPVSFDPEDATMAVDETMASEIRSSITNTGDTPQTPSESWVRPMSAVSRVRTGYTGTTPTGASNQDPPAKSGQPSWVFAVAGLVTLLIAAVVWFTTTQGGDEAAQGNRELAMTFNDQGVEILKKVAGDRANAKPEDIEEARQAFTNAAQASANYANPWNNLAELARLEGKLELAKENLEQALKINPKYGAAHANLAEVQESLEDFEGAERSYREAMKHDITIAAAPNNLGYLLIAQGKHQEAYEVLKKATSTFSDIAPIWKNYGLALEGLGRDQEAEEAFLKASELSRPGIYSAAIAGLARLDEARGDKEAAIKHWEAVMRGPNRALQDTAKVHLQNLR